MNVAGEGVERPGDDHAQGGRPGPGAAARAVRAAVRRHGQPALVVAQHLRRPAAQRRLPRAGACGGVSAGERAGGAPQGRSHLGCAPRRRSRRRTGPGPRARRAPRAIAAGPRPCYCRYRRRRWPGRPLRAGLPALRLLTRRGSLGGRRA